MEILIQSWDEIQALWCKRIDADLRIAAIIGDESYRMVPNAVLLLSQLPSRVNADEGWLRAVREAIHYVDEQGWNLVSSVGLFGWEYLSYYASRCGLPLLLILPPEPMTKLAMSIKKWTSDLRLNRSKTTFLIPIINDKRSKSERFHLRDRLMFQIADYRFPIAIRPNGFMEQMSQGASHIDNRFRVEYPKSAKLSWYNKIKQTHKSSSNVLKDMLIHWTRGTYAPWLGEVKADYFDALTDAKTGNPRDGLATLQRIFLSGVVRGDGRMIRGGQPVVSFMEGDPAKIVRLIRYRPALRRWTFEPYGIAFPRKILESLGVRPVVYGSKKLYNELPPDDRPFYQFCGLTNEWVDEWEWRLIGDLDMSNIRDKIMLIVPTEAEAKELDSAISCDVLSLEKVFYSDIT
ncbi:MAG: hypothetical protein P9M15_03285 [Candidatus Electryoneaceae bacterium]|nr:hypothetical protein [Candidatus Electryoneaceae bacterium]